MAEWVASAGIFTPWSFLIASLIAGLTAFTYAEHSSRYPLSAGEAVYLQAEFSVPRWIPVAGSISSLAFLS
jgi:amino acid transporter